MSGYRPICICGTWPGDLLFIDSTHTVKVGSEVNILILEVLPQLSPGCYAHFHDIYFPYDYPCALFKIPFFWNESVLLQAFLTGNARYSIAASLSMLHHAKPQALQMLLPNYSRKSWSRVYVLTGDQVGIFRPRLTCCLVRQNENHVVSCVFRRSTRFRRRQAQRPQKNLCAVATLCACTRPFRAIRRVVLRAISGLSTPLRTWLLDTL